MNQEVSYICDVCKDKLSAEIRKSKKYCRVHSFESSFVCAECSKLFGMAYEVTEKKPLFKKCKDKLQLDSSIRSLRIGYGVQSGTLQESETSMPKGREDLPYKCNLCDSSYKQKNSLCHHKYIHEGRFKCKTCSKCVSNKWQLIRHMQTHSDLKPYKCSVCSKRFKYSDSLGAHMNTHKKSNPFRCGLCKKDCQSKSVLKGHMAVHSDERPHKCSMCPKAYKRKGELFSHSKKHRKQDELHPGKKTIESSD